MGISSKRYKLFLDQNEGCFYCGLPMCYSEKDKRTALFSQRYGFKEKFVKKMLVCTIDHVLPRANGGTDCNNNLVVAHSYCNSKKQDMSFEKFFLISEIQIIAGTHMVLRWFENASKGLECKF